MVREEWYHRAVADSIDVFADAGQIPGEAVAKHMDYFQTAHAILLNEPAGREEALLRTECILEQDLSGYGFDEVLAAIDDAAFGPGSGSDSGIHCVRFNAAVQEFLHIAAGRGSLCVSGVEVREGGGGTWGSCFFFFFGFLCVVHYRSAPVAMTLSSASQ